MSQMTSSEKGNLSKKDFQNSFEKSTKDMEFQGSNENRLFQKRIQPSTTNFKESAVKESTFLSPVLNRSRALSTPEVYLKEPNNFSGAFSKPKRKVVKLKKDSSKLRSMSSPNMKSKVVPSNPVHAEGQMFDNEYPQERLPTPNKLFLPKMEPSHNLGMSLQSLSRSSTPGRDIDLDSPRTRQSLTPVGGRPVYNQYYSPRKASSYVRLDPLVKPNVSPVRGSHIPTNQGDFPVFSPSPTFTLVSKAYNHFEPTSSSSPSSAYAAGKTLKPVLEGLISVSEEISVSRIAQQPYTFDRDSAFLRQRNRDSAVYHINEAQNETLQGFDSQLKGVTPSLIDIDPFETLSIGQETDFQNFAADEQSSLNKLEEMPVRVKSSTTGSADKKSSTSALLNSALLSEHRSICKPDSAEYISFKSSGVEEKKPTNPDFNSADEETKDAFSAEPVTSTIVETNSDMFKEKARSSPDATEVKKNLSSNRNCPSPSKKSEPDPSSTQQPSSLELFVPDQDGAVKITINLSCDDKNDIDPSNQVSNVLPASEKPKPKLKSVSSRATEATNRLYKKPTNTESSTKVDPKKSFKNSKATIKKDPQAKSVVKKTDVAASKASNKSAKTKPSLSANSRKKKKTSSARSAEVAAHDRTRSANNGEKQKPDYRISTPLRSQANDTSSSKNNYTPLNRLKTPGASTPSNYSNRTASNVDSHVNVSMSMNNHGNIEGNIDGIFHNDSNDQNLNNIENGQVASSLYQDGPSKTEKKYNHTPIQTPIIVEAFPSAEETALLEKVALIKVVPPSKRAKTAIERKKKPLKLTLNRSKLGQKKSTKKSQKDDEVFDINESRAKSAGLTIEQRYRNGKKSAGKQNETLWKFEDEEKPSDFDNNSNKQSLISEKSGEPLVIKDKGVECELDGNELIMKESNSSPVASNPGKLSPIAEIRSLHSPESQLLEEHTDPRSDQSHVNDRVTDRLQSVEEDELMTSDANHTSTHRPESSLSILSLNTASVVRQISDPGSVILSLSKNKAWEESPIEEAACPSNSENEREQPSILNRNVMLAEDLPLKDEEGLPDNHDAPGDVVSRNDKDQSSVSDESESENELESYWKKLRQPRSEMDAKILHRPSISASESSDDATAVNKDTWITTSTLRDDPFDKETSKPFNSVKDAIEINNVNDQSSDAQKIPANLDTSDSTGGRKTFEKAIGECIDLPQSSHLIPSEHYDLINNNPVDFDEQRVFPHRFGSVCSVGSENDSENEMLEHMERTLYAPDSDESEKETVRAESECSIPIVENSDDENNSSTSSHVVRLTKSALKRHDSKLDLNPAEEIIDRAVSRLSEHSGQSYTTDLSLMSIADLNTEKCMGWKRGRLLDQGSFGKVWEGMTHSGQLIAVKQVELSMSCQDDAQKDFQCLQREVDILKDMRHPNIVSFIGTCLEENVVSIFMEYLTGGSISKILRNYGKLPERVFKKYTRQILEGVKYLHERSVVHRDINGKNVMLLPHGIIKLIDFGCSKRIHHRSIACSSQNSAASGSAYERQLKSMVGTPYWMAPEVITGNGHGSKSDIWSVGCTVVEMATTHPPLYDLNPTAAMFHIGNGGEMPPLPEPFTEHAKSFVAQCLKHDPASRLSAAALLNHKFLKGKKKQN